MQRETRIAVVVCSALLGIFLVVQKVLAAPPVLAQIWARDDLVLVAPEDDAPCRGDNPPALIWGACVLRKFAQEIGAGPYDKLPALADNLRGVILEVAPERIYGFGHGNSNGWTCEKCELFFHSSGLNLDLTNNRYVHLLSCLTAQTLGHKIIEAEAKAYFGYYEEFWLLCKVAPCSGRFVEAVVYGDLEIERELARGQEDLEAIYNRSVERFNEEISYWQEHWDEESCNGVGISEWEAQQLINVLIHDRDALRAYAVGEEYPAIPEPPSF